MKRLVFSCLLLYSNSLFSQPSGLNPDFGKNGKTLINLTEKTNEFFYPRAIQVGPDNRIYTGGTIRGEYAVQRMNPDGADDPTFGRRGFSFFDFGNSYGSNSIQDILKYPDGKILLVGNAAPSLSQINLYTTSQSLALVRLLPRGERDTAFGVKGKVIFSLGNLHLWVHSGILQPDGKIIIAARAAIYNAIGVADRPLLIRFNSNGTIDNSFGTQGVFAIPQLALTATAALEKRMALALQPDGKIILGDITAEQIVVNGGIGYRNSPAIFRITTQGRLDSSFAINGRFLNRLGYTDYQIRSILIQNDNKIVAAGDATNQAQWLIFRIRPDGQVDSSFATNGVFTYTNASWQRKAIGEICLTDNDKILAAAFHHTSTQSSIDVFRIKPNGTFDSTFAQSSIFYQRSIQSGYFLYDVKMVLDATQNPVVLGYTTNFPLVNFSNTGHLVIRLTKDGTAVTQLNGNGSEQFLNTTSPASGPDYNYGSADMLTGLLQFSNGKILLAGKILSERDNTQTIGLTKLFSGGKIDSSFGANGVKTFFPGNITVGTNAMLLLSDQKVIMNNRTLSVFKIDSTGKIDSSFGVNGIATTNLDVRDLVELPDKKILILSPNQILKLNANGSVDNTFAVNGILTLAQPFQVTGRKIQVQSNGDIFVGNDIPFPGGGIFLFKCSAAGVPYNSFGTFNNGYARVTVFVSGEISFGEFLHDFKILPDGKIIVLARKDRTSGIPNNQNPLIISQAGGNYRDIIVYRLNATGLIDGTFGRVPTNNYFGTSHLTLPFTEEFPGNITVSPDGRLFISGFFHNSTGWDAGIVILKASGAYDTTCSI